jgi:hypothetical protein
VRAHAPSPQRHRRARDSARLCRNDRLFAAAEEARAQAAAAAAAAASAAAAEAERLQACVSAAAAQAVEWQQAAEAAAAGKEALAAEVRCLHGLHSKLHLLASVTR